MDWRINSRMIKSTYYQDELFNVLEKNDIKQLSFKITGDKWSSKWMNLNFESIKELKKFLDRLESDLENQ